MDIVTNPPSQPATHLSDLVGLPGVEEDALRRRGLPRVDVRHNPDVAVHVQVDLAPGRGGGFSHATDGRMDDRRAGEMTKSSKKSYQRESRSRRLRSCYRRKSGRPTSAPQDTCHILPVDARVHGIYLVLRNQIQYQGREAEVCEEGGDHKLQHAYLPVGTVPTGNTHCDTRYFV